MLVDLVVALNGVVLATEDSMKGMGSMMGDMSGMMKGMSGMMDSGMMKGMSDTMGSGTMTKDDMMMQQEKMKKMKDQMSGM